MTTALIIVAAVIGSLLFMSIVTKVTLKLLARNLAPRVAERCKGQAVVRTDLGAMSFGQESKGKFQGRGNGALVLTTKEILFLRAIPQAELVIPLERVTNLSFVHSHLGKATPYKLLKIEFDGDAGQDSIACFLEDVTAFRDEIERVRAKAS